MTGHHSWLRICIVMERTCVYAPWSRRNGGATTKVHGVFPILAVPTSSRQEGICGAGSFGVGFSRGRRGARVPVYLQGDAMPFGP